ncbi:MAG: hypothetical protein MJ146_05135 [Clostridia bacterium]|nr:hypothetical protein [Clostridia bacterium]
MKEFTTSDQKDIKNTTRYAGLIFGVFLIISGYFRRSIYMAVIGIMFVAALIMVKKVVVNEEGIVTSYDAFFFKKKDVWEWKDITDIHKQLSPKKDQMALHFAKGMMAKRLIFGLDTYEKVLDLAREMKPEINIADVDW